MSSFDNANISPPQSDCSPESFIRTFLFTRRALMRISLHISALYVNEKGFYRSIFRKKHSTVFSIKHAIVIGPTPPGTGVMSDAFGSTAA